MKNKYIAAAYWRQIKKNNRTYESVPEELKETVKMLARSDVENGIITKEEYESLIGEHYNA